MYLNNPSMCLVCFKCPEEEFNLIKHHVKYYPEVIAYVHHKCHQDIHFENKRPDLIQYEPADSKKFYALAHARTAKKRAEELD